jgi:hypothetical protein
MAKATKLLRKDEISARYWEAVRQCLVTFHRYSEPDARKEVRRYEKAVRTSMKNPDLVYHEEPFYLACNLSGEQLELSEHRDAYESILAYAGFTPDD